MICDLHIHTPLCKHAIGDEREYIENAIKNGINILGFADHTPLPDEFDNIHRMSLKELDMYVKKINDLKSYYKDDIKILLSMEMDFEYRYIKFYENIKNNYPFDYIIGSVHFVDGIGINSRQYIDVVNQLSDKNKKTLFDRYFNKLNDMIKSDFFDIIAHFDIPRKVGFTIEPHLTEKINSIIKNIPSNTIVEINTSGFDHISSPYPSFDIIEILIKNNIKMCLSSDAHKPTQVGRHFKDIINFLKDRGVNNLYYIENKSMLICNI